MIAFAVAAVAAPTAQARLAGIAPGEAGYSGPVVEQTRAATNGNPLHFKIARETGNDAPLVGPNTSREPAEVVVVSPSSEEFGRSGAWVVAGLAFVALLLAAGAAVLIRQRGRPARV